MLSSSNTVARGCVHNNDSPFGGCRQVDIIDTNAGPSDDTQTRSVRFLEKGTRHFGTGSNDQCVKVTKNSA